MLSRRRHHSDAHLTTDLPFPFRGTRLSSRSIFSQPVGSTEDGVIRLRKCPVRALGCKAQPFLVLPLDI